jgi:hypothetical protein
MSIKHSPDPIREYIHQTEQEGLKTFTRRIFSKAKELLPNTLRKTDVMNNLQRILEKEQQSDDPEVALARFKGMLRYLMEQGSYHADPVQLHHLENEKVLQKGMSLIDLGTGSGEVVKEWSKKGPAVGIDASPSFVEASELLRLGLIDGDIKELKELTTHMGESRVALTSLTLDRAAMPKQLARNVIDLAGDKGKFMVASLFPIIAEDDEEVTHSIVYTPHRHRIAATGTEDGDLQIVQEFLQDYSHRKIQKQNIPYKVTTHSGVQEYKNYHALWTAE